MLGPLQVGRDEGVGGLAARVLLALAIEDGRPVDDGALLERVWPAGPPQQAIASLRNQVSRIRRTFCAGLVGRTFAGYRLNLDVCRLDLDDFAGLVAAARTCRDPAIAIERLDAALAMIRGRPFHEVADELWAMPAASAAGELLASAEERWADAVIAAGCACEHLARLRRATSEQPHREVRWRQLVVGLAAAGLRTDALRAAGVARRALAEYGVLPSSELLDVERQLIGTEADLPIGAARVPARRDPLVGRDEELAELLRPGAVVWVEGGPGTGKTRLLAEVADRSDGAAVAYVACSRPLSGGIAVVPALSDALTELTGWRPPFEPPMPAQDHDGWRLGLVGDLVERLRAVASERRTTVLLDDVQWLDTTEVAVVQDVVQRTMACVRWIAAARPVHHHPAAAQLRGELERSTAVRLVQLGDLERADVLELVDTLAPDAVEREALADAVMVSTGGLPLYASELIRHHSATTSPRREPPRLEAIITGALAALAPAGRRLVELLAVGDGPCPLVVLAAATDSHVPAVLEVAERLVAEGLVSPHTGATMDLRHDVVRNIVRNQLTPTSEVVARDALLRGLARDDRFVVAYADQLLRCGELLQGAQIAHRDRAVAAAIERLLRDVEYATAAGIAERYLDLPAGRGSRALAARLAAATALIASGDVGRGRSTLLAVIDEARATGDQLVLADAILAAGPLTTGGHERRAVLDDAEHLVATLPAEASSRRIQLACWAAHHWLLRGDRLRAEMLLATAAKDPRAGSDPVLEGLVLAIRAQADTLVEAGPEPARRSLDELRRFASTHPNLSTRAAVCLLGGRDAWVHGTMSDVAAVGAELSAIAEQLPRPDVRWWPLALEASIELAVGQSERAATAIETAARLGRQLKIDVAEPTALVQQLLLLLVNGELGSAAESLRPTAMSPGASAALLAGYGLACVEAGAVDAVVEVAALLREDCRLLVSVGSAWPQVAMCASEIAAAAGDQVLAQVLWTPLLRHRGTGLALHAAGYLGTVDRCLGLLAATQGDVAGARALLASAIEQERQRGAAAWERRAVADLEALRTANLRS